MSAELMAAALLGLLGLVMGSAVTALAWRAPRHISWVRGRSACPSCGATLAARDLIPLLSFALARGRCRRCGVRIGWRYPLTELICAAWAVLLFVQVGFSWAWLPLAFWGFLLVALIWTDLDLQLLPDALTLPGVVLGVAAAILLFGPGPGARHALFGIVTGSGVLWLLGWIWATFRKIEGMGGGDVKLAAMFGAVLGWQLTLVTLFVAALFGSLWGLSLILRRRGGMQSLLPFGTLLAPSALMVFLWGQAWLRAYVRLLLAR